MSVQTPPEALVAALLVASAVGVLPAATGATATNAASAVGALGHDSPGNYTVFGADDAEGSPVNSDSEETCIPASEAPTADEGNEGSSQNCDPYNGHMPGDENATYSQFAYGGEAAEKNISEVHYIIHYDVSKDFDMRGCAVPDAHPAGIDRHNDEPGYTINEDLTTHFSSTTEKRHRIIVKVQYDGLTSNELYLSPDDQIVAQVEDCYTNPSEPGWYQWRGMSNGSTSTGGQGAGEIISIELYSHYFYVCNCTSRQQAVNKLGPPPSADGSSSTPTPTATPGTVTPTGTSAPGPTPSPTDTTGNDNRNNDQNRATASPSPSPSPTPGGGGTPTNGASDDSPSGPGGSPSSPGGTPTVVGPGFGAVAALLALAGGALLALRR